VRPSPDFTSAAIPQEPAAFSGSSSPNVPLSTMLDRRGSLVPVVEKYIHTLAARPSGSSLFPPQQHQHRLKEIETGHNLEIYSHEPTLVPDSPCARTKLSLRIPSPSFQTSTHLGLTADGLEDLGSLEECDTRAGEDGGGYHSHGEIDTIPTPREPVLESNLETPLDTNVGVNIDESMERATDFSVQSSYHLEYAHLHHDEQYHNHHLPRETEIETNFAHTYTLPDFGSGAGAGCGYSYAYDYAINSFDFGQQPYDYVWGTAPAS